MIYTDYPAEQIVKVELAQWALIEMLRKQGQELLLLQDRLSVEIEAIHHQIEALEGYDGSGDD